ncbi:hypothetical protein OG625_38345 [Streptomyces sp. NBC_01351]|uniref:hypothetical protein n=1 Tax=Streptomyces sp. NBC_01351 TaxID=2903833 RepID=UPI002E2F7B00|nr:hypothetical protein [Streptomyces sp. NBC_01351]
MPLFWRIFTMNAIALVAVLVLLPSPWVTVSASMLFGVIAMLVTGALPFPLGLAPRWLQRPSPAIAAADLLWPGSQAQLTGHGETSGPVQTFNVMLDCLVCERATSGERVASARDAERRQPTLGLHDETGQIFTAVPAESRR